MGLDVCSCVALFLFAASGGVEMLWQIPRGEEKGDVRSEKESGGSKGLLLGSILLPCKGCGFSAFGCSRLAGRLA